MGLQSGFACTKNSSPLHFWGVFVQVLQSISQSFCQNIPNFVPKFVAKFKVHIENHKPVSYITKAFDWIISLHGQSGLCLQTGF